MPRALPFQIPTFTCVRCSVIAIQHWSGVTIVGFIWHSRLRGKVQGIRRPERLSWASRTGEEAGIRATEGREKKEELQAPDLGISVEPYKQHTTLGRGKSRRGIQKEIQRQRNLNYPPDKNPRRTNRRIKSSVVVTSQQWADSHSKSFLNPY